MQKLALLTLLIPSVAIADMNALINALTARSAAETRYLNEATITERLQGDIVQRAFITDLEYHAKKGERRNETYNPYNYNQPFWMRNQAQPRTNGRNRQQLYNFSLND